MVDPPALDRWDAGAAVSVVALLLVAYVVVPTPAVQYGTWLVVFCIWMAWFVFSGRNGYTAPRRAR